MRIKCCCILDTKCVLIKVVTLFYRSIAGSRLALNEVARNGSAASRPYTPVINATVTALEQLPLTHQATIPTITSTNSTEKVSASSTETVKPNPAAGESNIAARRDSKGSMYLGYVPVTPAISETQPDSPLKSSCTCRQNVMVSNKEVQTDELGSTLGRHAYADPDRDVAAQGNGSDRGQRGATSLDSGKGQG